MKMNIKVKKEVKFIDFFINKERDYLIKLNTEAFYSKDFKFYMEWFIYSIDEYVRKEYDIEKQFIYFFMNNFNLNIIFFIYIMSENFRKKVIEDILEYKKIYNKSNIYE